MVLLDSEMHCNTNVVKFEEKQLLTQHNFVEKHHLVTLTVQYRSLIATLLLLIREVARYDKATALYGNIGFIIISHKKSLRNFFFVIYETHGLGNVVLETYNYFKK